MSRLPLSVVAVCCILSPPGPAVAQGEAAASSGTDLDQRTRQIYDGGLPPIGQPSPTAGEESEATEGLQIIDRRGRDLVAKIGDARFTRHDGAVVTVADLFKGPEGEAGGGPPVLLCLNYSRCPMLCGRQQKLLAEGLRELTLVPGEDYRFVSLSIDPLETPATAADTRKYFVEAAGLPVSTGGIDFLVGDKDQIDRVADLVGFEYRYVLKQNEYAHPAAMIVLTPSGIISRYLNGLYGSDFDQRTLRFSVIEESGQGKVSTFVDRVLLTCFVYDNERGKYTPVAWGIMRLGAALTVVIMLAVLVPVWLKARWKSDEDDGLDGEGETTAAVPDRA